MGVDEVTPGVSFFDIRQLGICKIVPSRSSFEQAINGGVDVAPDPFLGEELLLPAGVVLLPDESEAVGGVEFRPLDDEEGGQQRLLSLYGNILVWVVAPSTVGVCGTRSL